MGSTSLCDLTKNRFSHNRQEPATTSIMTTSANVAFTGKRLLHVRFNPTVETREIPPVDLATKRAMYYSKREIEKFIALHYMEEMISILAFAYEVPEKDPRLSLHLGFDKPKTNQGNDCRRRVHDSNSHHLRVVL